MNNKSKTRNHEDVNNNKINKIILTQVHVRTNILQKQINVGNNYYL